MGGLRFRTEVGTRTGPEARVARGEHELTATGACARLGNILPNLTITNTTNSAGVAIETRVPFQLAMWLTLCLLQPSPAVSVSMVYMYLIGPQRLGAALEMALGAINGNEERSPSVLCYLLNKPAATHRFARGSSTFFLTCLRHVALEVNVIMSKQALNCRAALEPFG